MKMAFLVNGFPSLSETFIQDQITGLIRRGQEIEIEADQPSDLPKLHADVERFRLLERVHHRPPMPLAWPLRLRYAASRIFRWGCRHPGFTLDSFNPWRYGRRAMDLSLLYERLPAYHRPRAYDVIHCHYGPNGQRAVAARQVGALFGPIVTTFHGYDINRLPKIHGRKMYEDLFRWGDFFTVGSEFMRRRIVSLGAPEERVAKIPMGVDINRYRYCERMGWRDNEFRLLTVARLVECKGVEFIIRALAMVRAEFPRVRCTIAGDGPLRIELECLAHDLGLRQNIEFVGAVSQEEVLALYRNAHAFVLASFETPSGEAEGQSVVLLEAQSTGLPVIAAATGGVPESLTNGESGILVPPRDAGALARAILRLAQEPELCDAMGKTGRAYVEANFDQEKLLDRLIDIYDRAQSAYRRQGAGKIF